MYRYLSGRNAYQGTSSTGSVSLPSTPAPVAPIVPITPPAPKAELLPAPSLKGQTWGWPIPITAGKRTIPGRPVWRRIRPDPAHAGYYLLDMAVSFGFRAEIMGGSDPADFNFHRLLANGVVIRDWSTGAIATGVTVTEYDGTQTTADPFLVSVDGADDVQAFVYHIYCVVENLPLFQFHNVVPDAWAVEIFDVVLGSQFNLYDNSAGIIGSLSGDVDADWTSSPAYDFDRDKIYLVSYASAGIVVKEWSMTLHDSVETHPVALWGSFSAASVSQDRFAWMLRASGHVFTMPYVPGPQVVTGWAVNPGTNVITAELPGPISVDTNFSVATARVTPTGGAARDCIGLAAHPSNVFHLIDYSGTALTQLATITLPLNTVGYVTAGPSSGNTATFFVVDFIATMTGGWQQAVYKVTATYTSPTAATLSYVMLGDFSNENYPFDPGRIMPTNDGGLVLAWDESFPEETTHLAKILANGDVDWVITIDGMALPPLFGGGRGGGNASIITNNFILFGYTITHPGGVFTQVFKGWTVNATTGAVIEYVLPDFEDIYGDEGVFFDNQNYQFDATTNRIENVNWIGSEAPIYEIVLGGTVGETEGITLARALTLMGDLTRGLKINVQVDPSITDTVGCLFIVEQGSFTTYAQSISRLCNVDIREANRGVQVDRVVEGDAYVVDLALTEADLLRAPGESGLVLSRAGDDALPSEVRAQFIASEATFKFTEQRARRDFGPMATSKATRVDTVRVPLGMAINKGLTYVSQAMYREAEMRAQVQYTLPWSYAVKVQPGDVHSVPDGDDTLIVKVTRADLAANRTVVIQGMRLHTAQTYAGLAYEGESLSSFSATGDA